MVLLQYLESDIKVEEHVLVDSKKVLGSILKD